MEQDRIGQDSIALEGFPLSRSIYISSPTAIPTAVYQRRIPTHSSLLHLIRRYHIPSRRPLLLSPLLSNHHLSSLSSSSGFLSSLLSFLPCPLLSYPQLSFSASFILSYSVYPLNFFYPLLSFFLFYPLHSLFSSLSLSFSLSLSLSLFSSLSLLGHQLFLTKRLQISLNTFVS